MYKIIWIKKKSGVDKSSDQIRQFDRAEQIDIYRALGIILMIMGHIGFGRAFDHFIHSFHMPMFFFISGLFFKVNCGVSLGAFVKRKAKTLLLPYVVFGMFHYCVWLIQNWPEVSLDPLKSLFFVNTDGLPIAGALWFLTALFFAEIFYFLTKRFLTKRMGNIAIIMITVLGCTSSNILQFKMPYALDAAFVGVGLIHIGYLVRSNRKTLHRIFELKYYEWLIIAGITSVLIFANGYVNMRTGSYAFIPLTLINIIFSIVVGINLAQYLTRIFPPRIRKVLTSIGRESIVYLCLNQFVILLINKGIKIALIFDINFKSSFLYIFKYAVSKFIIFGITMAILYMCACVLARTKFKILLGK